MHGLTIKTPTWLNHASQFAADPLQLLAGMSMHDHAEQLPHE